MLTRGEAVKGADSDSDVYNSIGLSVEMRGNSRNNGI